MKRTMMTLAAMFCLPAGALAQQPTQPAQPTTPEPVAAQPAAPVATFTVEDLRLTSGVQNREPLDAKTKFATGESAYVWLKLKPEGEAQLRLRWSLNGTPVWTMDPVAVKLGRTWYYKTLDQPGSWKVEVLDASDTVQKEAAFAVTGTATTAAIAPAPAAADQAAAPTTSAHFDVLDLVLSKEIVDRNPGPALGTAMVGDKVFSWVKLVVKDPETTVRFRWSKDGAEVFAGEPLTVKQSTGWRTWQYKTTDVAGAWKVEILDAENNVVKVAELSVQ